MATEKEVQIALRKELCRLVSNITQLGETLEMLGQRVEDVYLNSNLSEAVQARTLARDVITRAQT